MARIAVGILGLGFTGERVARRLVRRGVEVQAVARRVERFAGLAAEGVRLSELAEAAKTGFRFPEGARVLYSVPPIPPEEREVLLNLLRRCAPMRVVYLSSTGIYGIQEFVNDKTPPRPADERGWKRLDDENRISAGPWSTLVLRPAAIYGPNRGIHAAIRTGRQPRGTRADVVSRIHVEDLAALAEAALFADMEGAWPAADEDPSPSLEIVKWCGARVDEGQNPRVFGRSVDGRAVCQRLGVKLAHLSWKTGVPASIAEENAAP